MLTLLLKEIILFIFQKLIINTLEIFYLCWHVYKFYCYHLRRAAVENILKISSFIIGMKMKIFLENKNFH